MITTDTSLLHDPRRQAALLYWQGFSPRQIAETLGQKIPTVNSWKRRDKWDDIHPISRVETSIESRLIQLIAKPKKDGGDYKEIDLLGRQIERLARVNRYSQTGNEADLNPNVRNRNKGERKAPKKNYFSEEAIEKLKSIFFEQSFGYQLGWHEAGLKYRIRDILKSRQIGATFYFSRESLLRALDTGHNQIFLSASKTQAYVFREYIIQFARMVDVELTGDPIVLGNNGAKLIFLGTNSNTAQSHNGDRLVDEIFWIPNFQKLRKVASGMASQKHLRTTYFSTPSTLAHGAYPFWSGELFNKGRSSADDRVDIDISHRALAKGALCADGQWRQIVTIEDALAGGCDLFDLDTLKRENSAEDFRNLFMCEFVDDKASVFPFEELQACMVDSRLEWEDFIQIDQHPRPFGYRPVWIGYDPSNTGDSAGCVVMAPPAVPVDSRLEWEDFIQIDQHPRPFGYRPVWIGYDPSNTGDSAGCVVMAPPAVPGGKFRILERYQWKGMDFATQAESIKALTEKYVVEYIGIDATGIGQGVYQLVRNFFPAVREIRYSAEVKTNMVLKAKDLITTGRLEYDIAYTDITLSFMAIRKTMTASGRGMTYVASRSEEVSHADIAWAAMHAMINEPLTAGNGNVTPSILEFN
ncbi:terminase ATPase subunit family protein [Hafnia paralvei]|nr:terminase ATPase subunit family protein [Hafnia paralvei]MCQ4171907.1 terminase ATPase subunit family protein [Hafnia paralvei]